MHIITIFLCSLLFYSGVHSFDAGWTASFLRSEDATHYSLTECALLDVASVYLRSVYNITTNRSVISVENGQCRTNLIYNAIDIELDKLKLDKKRLLSAIETVARANTRMDLFEATREATHFDSEQFDEGALLISQRLDAAVASVTMKNYEQARESFGALLHTVQDFYSHSNWIEIGHRDPHKSIGKYQILGKYASRGMRTCVDCEGDACRTNIHPSITENNVLTSGYFGLQVLGVNFGDTVKPVGKCSHGNSFDYTIHTDAKGGGINKDSVKSDHGHLHNIAASVAYNATKQILTEFWTIIGEEPFGQFLGLSTNLRNLSANSLIIVMDDTSSMRSYIEMAKQIAISIVNIHQTLEYKPSNYILSPFNDPTWGPVTISKTPEQFASEISNLTAHAGDDEPELYYHGILEALKVCEIGSFMYVFTDAPAKDAYMKSQTVQLAKEKRVTITLFYAKNILRKQQTGRAFAKIDDLIERLDENDGNSLPSITGGVTMGINVGSLNTTKDYIIQRLEADKLATIIFTQGTNMNVTFHIDSSIDTFQIEVTAKSSLSPAGFRLMKPSGQELLPTPTSRTPFVLMYTVSIKGHETGEWMMISHMNTEHTVQLNAVSNTSCSSTLQKEIIGSSSNTSFTPLITQPIKQEKDLFVLTICEKLPSDVKTGYIDLIDAKDGSKILQTLSPMRVSQTGFLSKIIVPDVDFRLSTIVILQDMTKIQRQGKQTISPTPISVSINDQPYIVALNNVLAMNYTIYNHNQTPLTITLRVTSTLDLIATSDNLKNYTVAGLCNVSDTIEVNTYNISKIDSNSTLVTDSVRFSLTTLNYEYDQSVPLYIVQRNVSLTNQSDYQPPPTSAPTPMINGVVKDLGQSAIIFMLSICLVVLNEL